MLNTLSNLVDAIQGPQIVYRSSTCADSIIVDMMSKTARVMFNNGSVYEYTNVSRRAILNLLNNSTISLGFWINKNLVGTTARHCYTIN